MTTRRSSSLSSLLLHLVVVIASALTSLWLTLEDKDSASALHAIAHDLADTDTVTPIALAE